jgi:hypothetical protein
VKTVLGWSPDGSAIYYAVEEFEGGQRVSSVWRLPMRERQVAGAPTLVRGDLVGNVYFAFAGDRLFYYINASGFSFWSASVDLDAGRVVAPPSVMVSADAFTNHVDWTPDGADFAYPRLPVGPGRPGVELVLHSAATGEERTIRLGLDYVNGQLPWGDNSLLLRGTRRGRTELVRVDFPSGRVTPLDDTDLLERLDVRNDAMQYPRFSADMSVEYRVRESGVQELVAREIGSGAERVLYQTDGRLQRMTNDFLILSPNGQQLAFFVGNRPPGAPPSVPPTTNELRVVPVDGGTSRVVFAGIIGGSSVNWTSDSRTLVFQARTEDGERGLWKVGVDGRDKVLLFAHPDLAVPRIHPDGRRVVFRGTTGERVQELWVLENLVESRSTSTSR